ncbi:HupE/UreJ family protein [Archangium violaceum]|uniref:HupE/UreJ family protein n=1 Tax=Archangium violaceum TaxID=83451 RepID=UPI00194E0E0C|nr:HupE/UreJ family protein [Archangium violaceum]QRN95018.1 HupE/UreJ family protein [Archangium violaceum]
MKQVVKIVTAFTLGHSMTLVAGAVGPLFSGREPLIAAGFGLVHGLAFSTVLAELGLDSQALVLSVLAFNLGIEAMQLAVVAMTMPWLLLLSRSPEYATVRIVGASLGAVAACGWIAERAFSIQNPIAPLVEAGSHQALAGIVLLATLSVIVAARSRIRAHRMRAGDGSCATSPSLSGW